MESFLYNFFATLCISFIISNVFAILYNIFIGIPLGLKIQKEKKYKKVTATRITGNGQYDRDQMLEDRKKYVFKYKWIIDGKTYKKTITTEYYPLEVDTFYYLKPNHAMPSPEELARFRYTKELFLIIFVIVFLMFLK